MNSLASLNTQNTIELTHAAMATSPIILCEIYKPEHHIVVWQRQLAKALKTDIAHCVKNASDLNINACIETKSIAADVSSALKKLSQFTYLKNNIVELVDMFCCLFELQRVGLRLRVLTHAMCPRFHVDRVPCRLVTTFAGRGSEWLPHHGVDRCKLGAGNQGLSDEKSGLYADHDIIQTLNVGDVALLKGETWLGNENMGIVHRSPRLKKDEKRLLLTLDFID
ncbi:DUF1826 domain-containing protein [Pseudoalteromonas mariniglutinosa]|uniref:DUF1826 domain-containing protein n=1 Tax=Pseudoalteromonas mariniglutinosa TaxID=206042 RepID=UPI0038501FC5